MQSFAALREYRFVDIVMLLSYPTEASPINNIFFCRRLKANKMSTMNLKVGMSHFILLYTPDTIM